MLTSTGREWRPVVNLDQTTIGGAQSEGLLASVTPSAQLDVVARGIEGVIGQDFLFGLQLYPRLPEETSGGLTMCQLKAAPACRSSRKEDAISYRWRRQATTRRCCSFLIPVRLVLWRTSATAARDSRLGLCRRNDVRAQLVRQTSRAHDDASRAASGTDDGARSTGRGGRTRSSDADGRAMVCCRCTCSRASVSTPANSASVFAR